MTFDAFLPAAALVRGNRMSSLGVAEYCAQSATLGAKYGAGRSAAMSKVFHARCAGHPDPVALTEQESATVDTWIKPTSITLPSGLVLEYEAAEKEVELYLGSDGEFTPLADQAVSVGHLDFAWTQLDLDAGKRVVYVVDIKRTPWTAKSPRILQLIAYAHAYAGRKQADGYVTGIYVAEHGEWQFDSEVTWVDSEKYAQRRDRLLFAIHNHDGEASTGAHCRDCWSRLHCPEHVLPTAASSTWMRPFAEGGELTPQTAASLKLALQAAEEVHEKCNDNLKEYMRRGGLVETPDGSRLKLQNMPGRESVSVAKLRAELGEAANKYIVRGPDYVQTGKWSKPLERA